MSEYGRRARPSLLGEEWLATANRLHPVNIVSDAAAEMGEVIASGEIQLSPISYVIDALTAIRDQEETEPGCTTSLEGLNQARDLISEAITALEAAPAASTRFDPQPGQ